MIHFLLAFHTLVVMVGITTTVLFFVCHKKKLYLTPFQLFYFCFTLIFLFDFLASYAITNIQEESNLFVFLMGAAGAIIGDAMLFFAIKTFHVLLMINRPKTEWFIIAGLVLGSIIMVSPVGIEYMPEISAYKFKLGSYFSGVVSTIIFTYLISISILRVWKIVDKADRYFGILLFAFVFMNYVRTIIGGILDDANPVHALADEIDHFDFSTVVYFLFSLFLIKLLFRTIVQNSNADTLLVPEKLSIYGFTGREQELLPLVLSGKSNQQIADTLNISVTTVKTHLGKIFKKSDVKSRFELAQKLKS